MLKDEMYCNDPQVEDNLDKIYVLDVMMSVNQTKPVLAPWNMRSKTCACKYRGMDDVSWKKAPVYAK